MALNIGAVIARYKVGDILLMGNYTAEYFHVVSVNSAQNPGQYVLQAYYASGTPNGYPFALDISFVDNNSDWHIAQTTVRKYWITIAAGQTMEELKAAAVNAQVYGPFRLVMETRNVPSWVLSSGTWLANALKTPLNDIGISLSSVEIKGNTILVYMHASPHVLIPILAVIGLAFVVTGMSVYWISNLKVQQEISEQLAIDLETAQTKQEVTDAILANDLPPEIVNTLIKSVWDSGSKPEDDTKIDWEKYLKWGLIGGAVILLLPTIMDLMRSSPRLSREGR